MKKQPITVVLLAPRAEVVRAFRRAFAGHATVRIALDTETAAEQVRSAPYGSAVIVDADGEEAEARVRSLRTRLPDVPVLAIVHTRETAGRLAFLLYQAGCDELLSFPEERTSDLLRHRVARAVPDDILDVFDDAVAAGLPGRTRRLLKEASRIGMLSGFPRDLAARLHASPSTVLRWFERARLPNPRTTLLLVRMLVAARMLENPERSVEEVARATGYSTPQALRKAMREVIHLSPSALRRRRAFDTAARAVQDFAPD